MSELAISFLWLLGLTLVVLAFKPWRNRDSKGAATLIWAIVLGSLAAAGLWLSFTARADAAERPELRAGLGYSFDNERVGGDPTGTVWVTWDAVQRGPWSLGPAQLHISSLPDNSDDRTYDATYAVVGRELGRARLNVGAGHEWAGVGGWSYMAELRVPVWSRLELAPLIVKENDGWLYQVNVTVRIPLGLPPRR